MKTVLSTLVTRLRLRPADPAPERVARRTITLTPSRGAEVVVEPLGGQPRPAGRAPAEAVA